MIRALARLGVENPVAANLAMLAVLAAGVMAYLQMPREVFPEFSMETIEVGTIYPGAAPEDVERLVTLPIEDLLEHVDGWKELGSQSRESLSTITLKLHRGTDVDRFLADVRAELQRGDLELPEAAEEPYVREIRTEFPVIAFFVYGRASEEDLRREGEIHRRELERIPGVAEVTVSGLREPRLWIEVDPLALERYGLSLASVGAAVGSRSLDVPLGSLTTSSGDYLLRVEAEVDRAEDLRDLPLISRPDGVTVRLSQVARVSDTYSRPVTLARFNGQPCVHMQVRKLVDGDIIEIARDVQDYARVARDRVPEGMAVGTNSDLSIYVQNRLRVMTESGTLGGIFVLVSLVLFLNLRVAFITALGIPISFLGGLLIADGFGISMNMITMFALIIVLGMVVDDAIVVGENCYRLMEEGLPPKQAALQGILEVGKPVTATILTTVAAFMPILLIGGTIGEFMKPLPLVVSFCLFASLFEALAVLPSHVAHWSGPQKSRVESAESRWYAPLRSVYKRLLSWCLRWRYATLTFACVLAICALGFAALRMPFSLFDDFESKVFYVNMRMDPSSSLEETEAKSVPVEEAIFALPENEFESANTLVGLSALDASRYELAQNLAQVWVEVQEGQADRRPTSAIIEGLRRDLSPPPPGIERITIDQPQAGPVGKAVDLSVRGPEIEVLRDIAQELERYLVTIQGVRDVRTSWEEGKREVRLILSEVGRSLGFDEARLGAELRAAFEGTRFATLRQGRDEVEVVVKLPESVRDERGVLEGLRVTAPDGRRLPLATVADFEEVTGVAVIRRDEGERSLRVTADVAKDEANAGDVLKSVAEEFANLPNEMPGYSLAFKGEYEDTQESLAGLTLSLTIASLAIYLILGTLFKSFTQPIVIMLAVPLAGIGVVSGHLLMDRGISFMSLTGFLALAGVVVNDSLILVDRVNVLRAEGKPLLGALELAGEQRFRPILLTSVTTMLGLSPLTFFAQGQARFLQPMAISIFFGLAFATLLILVVVPCAYGVLMDLHKIGEHPWRGFGRLLRGQRLHETESALPSGLGGSSGA